MATVEELEKELRQFKLDFLNHVHAYNGHYPTSKTKYLYRCPQCNCMAVPRENCNRYYCQQCGREFTGADCMMWYGDVPMVMPREDPSDEYIMRSNTTNCIHGKETPTATENICNQCGHDAIAHYGMIHDGELVEPFPIPCMECGCEYIPPIDKKE